MKAREIDSQFIAPSSIRTHLHVLATPSTRVFTEISSPSITEGRPGAGRTHGPPAKQKAGGSHHRCEPNIRPSLRDGLTAYTWSPRGPARLPPLATMRVPRIAQASAPGGQNRTISPAPRIRSSARANPRCDPTRPPHPSPDVRDDPRSVPSSGAGWMLYSMTSEKKKEEFCAKGGQSRAASKLFRKLTVGATGFRT